MKLDLGCGLHKREGYEGVDVVAWEGVEHVCDLTKPLPFTDNTVEAIQMSHVLEHFVDGEVLALLREANRILIPNGAVEVVVPDILEVLDCFKNADFRMRWTWWAKVIYGDSGAVGGEKGKADQPYQFHKTAFDVEKLHGFLEHTGFRGISIEQVWSHDQPCLRAVAYK